MFYFLVLSFIDVANPNNSEFDGSEVDAEQIRHSLSQLHLESPLQGGSDVYATVRSADIADTRGNIDSNPPPEPPLDVGENSDILVAMSTTPGKELYMYFNLQIY